MSHLSAPHLYKLCVFCGVPLCLDSESLRRFVAFVDFRRSLNGSGLACAALTAAGCLAGVSLFSVGCTVGSSRGRLIGFSLSVESTVGTVRTLITRRALIPLGGTSIFLDAKKSRESWSSK